MKKYEALFVFSNAMSDEQLEAKIEKAGSEIAKQGGTVQAATRMGRITFARPLAKKEAGLYVQMVFLMEPSAINALHERYRHDEDLLRLQIVVAKPPAEKSSPAAADQANPDSGAKRSRVAHSSAGTKLAKEEGKS